MCIFNILVIILFHIICGQFIIQLLLNVFFSYKVNGESTGSSRMTLQCHG